MSFLTQIKKILLAGHLRIWLKIPVTGNRILHLSKKLHFDNKMVAGENSIYTNVPPTASRIAQAF